MGISCGEILGWCRWLSSICRGHAVLDQKGGRGLLVGEGQHHCGRPACSSIVSCTVYEWVLYIQYVFPKNDMLLKR